MPFQGGAGGTRVSGDRGVEGWGAYIPPLVECECVDLKLRVWFVHLVSKYQRIFTVQGMGEG